MKEKGQNRISIIVLLLITVVFLLLFYPGKIFHPNSYMFGTGGDAMKNYFTYASQINNNGLINSEMMNYPYGENILYLDCNPLATFIIKVLKVPFPSFSTYSIGIINFLLIFSLSIASLFLYLVLRTLKVNRFFSVLGGLSIAIFSPQIFRIGGHFALAFSFFLPMSWYFYLRFRESGKQLKWSVIIFLNNLAWYFVHAYLGMIAVSFLFLTFIFDFIFYDRKKLTKPLHWFLIFLQTFAPLLLFWLFARFTDTHLGRTSNPYGFLIYTANPGTVFLPTFSPFEAFFNKLIVIEKPWEGWSYIGLGSVLVFLIFIVNLFRKSLPQYEDEKSQFILSKRWIFTSLSASVLLLILSMGYPFKLKLDFLLAWIPLIKEFRGIGRFAWAFYYVATVSAIFYTYYLYKTQRQKVVYFILALLLPISYSFEGAWYHREMSKIVNNEGNLFNSQQLPAYIQEGLSCVSPDDFQAIIPLPFYHIGSENFGKVGTDKIYRLSMLFSYYSGLPLMSNYSTRTSIPESKKIMQLLAPGYYKKPLSDDIKSEKPFLVIYSREELIPTENAIIEKGQQLFSNDDYALYSVSKNALFENTSETEINSFSQIRDQLIESRGFLTNSSDSIPGFIIESYDDKISETTFLGKGAFTGIMKDYNVLTIYEPGILKSDTEYLINFWMFNGGDNFGQDALTSILFVQAEDSAGNIEWIANSNPANSININGEWSLIELAFKVDNNNKKYSIYLKGENYSKKSVIADELLIREKGLDVYRIVEEKDGQIKHLTINNQSIRIP